MTWWKTTPEKNIYEETISIIQIKLVLLFRLCCQEPMIKDLYLKIAGNCYCISAIIYGGHLTFLHYIRYSHQECFNKVRNSEIIASKFKQRMKADMQGKYEPQ